MRKNTNGQAEEEADYAEEDEMRVASSPEDEEIRREEERKEGRGREGRRKEREG